MCGSISAPWRSRSTVALVLLCCTLSVLASVQRDPLALRSFVPNCTYEHHAATQPRRRLLLVCQLPPLLQLILPTSHHPVVPSSRRPVVSSSRDLREPHPTRAAVSASSHPLASARTALTPHSQEMPPPAKPPPPPIPPPLLGTHLGTQDAPPSDRPRVGAFRRRVLPIEVGVG
jgi:hypothetical protein